MSNYFINLGFLGVIQRFQLFLIKNSVKMTDRKKVIANFALFHYNFLYISGLVK